MIGERTPRAVPAIACEDGRVCSLPYEAVLTGEFDLPAMPCTSKRATRRVLRLLDGGQLFPGAEPPACGPHRIIRYERVKQ